MILLVHMFFGALIASKVKIIWLACLVALFCHYLLDFIPHNEYTIESIKNQNWNNIFTDALKVAMDFSVGIFLIYTFSNTIQSYIVAFFSIIPDGLTVLSSIFPNKVLDAHNDFHRTKMHYFKYKKISTFWRIFSQAAVIIIAIFIF